MPAEPTTTSDSVEVDIKKHAKDYSLLISMLKWGAIASFIIAMLVMVIISN